MSDLPLYFGFRILSGLVGALPEPGARRLGEALGWLMSFVAPTRLALVERHLLRVTGSERDLRRRARHMFASYGRYWAEVFWIRPRRKATVVAHTDLEHGERIHAARDADAGLIVALPHIGNWEAAGARAEAEGIRVLAAAEALPNRRVVDWFIEVRRAMGIDVVITGNGRRATVELAERLRGGGTVALLADRDLTGRGIEVDFFGERTTIPAGPLALADRTGATLMPVGCYFKARRGHRFVAYPPIEFPDVADREERIAVAAQRFAAALEDIIREAPEQWHLFQPNWPSDREDR
jgi:KDO2-lipid IV(A) lauroyltransferase